jgi:hypothetical protein
VPNVELLGILLNVSEKPIIAAEEGRMERALDVETSVVGGFNAAYNEKGYAVKFRDRRKDVEYSEGDYVVRVAVETTAAEDFSDNPEPWHVF